MAAMAAIAQVQDVSSDDWSALLLLAHSTQCALVFAHNDFARSLNTVLERGVVEQEDAVAGRANQIGACSQFKVDPFTKPLVDHLHTSTGPKTMLFSRLTLQSWSLRVAQLCVFAQRPECIGDATCLDVQAQRFSRLSALEDEFARVGASDQSGSVEQRHGAEVQHAEIMSEGALLMKSTGRMCATLGAEIYAYSVDDVKKWNAANQSQGAPWAMERMPFERCYKFLDNPSLLTGKQSATSETDDKATDEENKQENAFRGLCPPSSEWPEQGQEKLVCIVVPIDLTHPDRSTGFFHAEVNYLSEFEPATDGKPRRVCMPAHVFFVEATATALGVVPGALCYEVDDVCPLIAENATSLGGLECSVFLARHASPNGALCGPDEAVP
jgi:hypothetical protein